jgi:ElaB/YqjD/DUF883 family membrane-anchored ribosome-binding protein
MSMNDGRRPADIEREIHETQAEMDSTLEALRSKLSPGELVGQTLGYIRDSGSDMGRGFREQVRENPLPIALLATGLGWLMTAGSRGRRRPGSAVEGVIPSRRRAGPAGYPSMGELGDADYRTVSQYGNVFQALARVRPRMEESNEDFCARLYPALAEALEMKQEPAEETHGFRERVQRAFDELSSRAQDAQQKISMRTQSQWQRARKGARETVGAAREQVSHVGERVGYRARRVGDQAADFYNDYPLAAGAIAVALGAFVGAALPSTRQERRLLGRTGEDLRQTAGEYVRETARAAGDVAGRMASTARERAEAEGLTPERGEEGARDLSERLRRTGEEAVEAGREEAERRIRGMGPGRTGGGRS